MELCLSIPVYTSLMMTSVHSSSCLTVHTFSSHINICLHSAGRPPENDGTER